jgi:F0F1-type ATP synthase epsilon subunit
MAEEIDLVRAEEAKKRAEEAMQRKASMDETDYARVAAAIEKEMARVKVAKKHHTRQGIKIN